MVSSCRNNGTISQELRYPFTGTVVQFWQESSWHMSIVNFEGISNSDIRKIFGLGEKEKAKASRLLTSAVDGGYIKVMNPDTAPRYKKYIPYWA